MLEGLMQNDYQLTLKHVLDRMRGQCSDGEVATLRDDGITRASYGEVTERVDRLCKALEQLGVKEGDRVATFMWNSQEHLELYMTPCMGDRAAHAQHPPVPRTAHLHRQPRAGQGDLRRRLARPAAREGRADVRDGRALRDRRRRRRRLSAECAALRGTARRAGTRALRLPRARRAHCSGPLLHERHHREPEGRPVLAPLERAALPRHGPRRHAGHQGVRPRAARCPDVPRERLGDPLRVRDGGRRPGDARQASCRASRWRS